MALFATNVFFITWILIDTAATETKIIDGLSFYHFLGITNGALIIISVFSITYKNLGDRILVWGYSNGIRAVLLVVLSVLIFVVACFLLFIVHFELQTNTDVLLGAFQSISNSYFLSLTVFFSFVSLMMFFISNLERRSGNVLRLMSQSMGNSLRPKLVERGFMFIDLNNATSLAETLTSKDYANLLRDCFLLLNELVDVSPFEIYQYVGDEAVITWEADTPNADLKALHLFSDFKAYLKENKNAFTKEYNTEPKFKCAIHCGEVVQSEIGKEIKHLVYHGDVLNTTSRLLSQCHHYNTDVIISKDTVSGLNIVTEKYHLSPMVCNNLKGKQNSIEAFVVTTKRTKGEENTSDTITFFLAPKVTVSHSIFNDQKVVFK